MLDPVRGRRTSSSSSSSSSSPSPSSSSPSSSSSYYSANLRGVNSHLQPGDQYDVVVIGAGIMGSAIAYECSKLNQKVLLIEQFDFLHSYGSSHGESRIIRSTYPEDHYTRMMKHSYRLWEAVQKDAGMRVITRTGGLDFGPRDNTDLQALVTSARNLGVAHHVLQADQVMRHFPALQLPQDNVGVYSPDGGVIHATKAVAMFQHLARRYGAKLRDRTKVLGIFAEKCEDGSDTVRIKTNAGIITANKCVVAAGAWSRWLLKDVCGYDLPVEPLHVTVAYWRVEQQEALCAMAGFPIFLSYNEHTVYGLPVLEYPGLVKVCLHAGSRCNPNRRSFAPEIEPLMRHVAPFLEKYFAGQVNVREPAMADTCLHAMTPDEDFLIDFVPVAKWGGVGQGPKDESFMEIDVEPRSRTSPIVIAAGFAGHGFQMAPLVGKAVAELVTTGTSKDIPLEKFSLRRFHGDTGGKGDLTTMRPHVRSSL